MKIFQNPLCLYCHSPIEENAGWANIFFLEETDLLCPNCRSQLAPIQGMTCERCFKPIRNPGKCPDCEQWALDTQYGEALDYNISLYGYNPFMKELIARFKYRGDYELARLFARELRKKAPKADFVISIPLSQERLHERGFNQADAIGVMGKFQMENGLIRVHGEKQSKKNRFERIHTKQVFCLHPKAPDFHDKTILILDDIYTTGTTLRHAGAVLKEAGARCVISLTIAR